MRQMPRLKLQFDPKKLSDYAGSYNANDDEKALKAGQRIADGNLTYENLSEIFEWKTKGRGRSRIERNKDRDKEIEEILRIALTAKYPRTKIAVLTGLDGVGVPVASAILTAIDPENYTIIDYRALEALGTGTKDRSVNFYLQYLDRCRELATAYKIRLRDFDHALWKWSEEQSNTQR